jgi:hypothetical protein
VLYSRFPDVLSKLLGIARELPILKGRWILSKREAENLSFGIGLDACDHIGMSCTVKLLWYLNMMTDFFGTSSTSTGQMTSLPLCEISGKAQRIKRVVEDSMVTFM